MLDIEVIRVLSILLEAGSIVSFAVLLFFAWERGDCQGPQAHGLCALPTLPFSRDCSTAPLLSVWGGDAWLGLWDVSQPFL